MRFARYLVAVVACAALAVGLVQLHAASEGLTISRTTVGTTPVTIFQPARDGAVPVVVIAHGFAGSQQLMQPFAETLARNGYMAVTFDFLGHGRNPNPMRGDITEGETITSALMAELGQVAARARTLPGSDGRLAVLGHSMASDIVVRFAKAAPDVLATVAVSVFSPVVTASSPRNLLVIVGSLEPSMLKNEGLRIVGLAASGDAIPGTTYGQLSDGTARRLVFARGVEHIGVLYSHDSMEEVLAWMNGVFGRQTEGPIDSRGGALALVFFGLIALAWPLSGWLPMVRPRPAAADLPWRLVLVAAVVPAITTPLILWKFPTDFLPILLGDYLALHFLIYGIQTAVLWLLWRRTHMDATVLKPAPLVIPWRGIAGASLAISAYNIIAFGWPIDSYVFSFQPIAARVPMIAAMACGTLPYFIVDECLTRGPGARRGSYLLTKICFLLSLGIAVALNPMKLFFLVIIVPAILLLFLAFGLIGFWCARTTHHPLPGAIASAAVFAWGIAVTFPMVTR